MKPQEHDSQNQLSRAHRASWRLNRQSQSLHTTRLGLHICYGYVAWRFCGIPYNDHGSVSGWFSVLISLVLLLDYLIQPRYEGFCLESYFILLCHVNLTSLEGLLFAEKKWKRSGSERGVDLGRGRVLGGVEGEETEFEIYCIRKE